MLTRDRIVSMLNIVVPVGCHGGGLNKQLIKSYSVFSCSNQVAVEAIRWLSIVRRRLPEIATNPSRGNGFPYFFELFAAVGWNVKLAEHELCMGPKTMTKSHNTIPN